ncbi:MAG TPA: nitroreductase family protein [Desulfurivibrionaceae bacterium]|nr:nitroreductase family protein [Desulfurivibrionaceae bacterium]
MHPAHPVHIDSDRCTGCGLCVSNCPADTLAMQDGRAALASAACMACGHCAALCPTGAITVVAAKNTAILFATFTTPEKWLPYGQGDLGTLVQLMRSRRSCRNYTRQPVDRALLTDLVKIGTTAPSGTNSQGWTFTILPDRDDVVALGEAVADYFRRLNRLANAPLLRHLLRLCGRTALDHYYRRHYATTAKALREWDENGRDRLFHGATAAILVGGRPGASCPSEDALLATQNIVLAAHAMGLGSCLIGFVVEAMKRDAQIGARLGLPRDETVHSVIALGWPAHRYQRLTGRRPIAPRWVTAVGKSDQMA